MLLNVLGIYRVAADKIYVQDKETSIRRRVIY